MTLIFSLERHKEVMEAYIRGLERLVESGGDPKQVHSVASFFVSRVDTEADKRLDEIGGDATKLKGKLAIANAKLAYQNYLEVFAGPRWDALEAKGATKQRCLWASTSTKNPDYRDVMYVEELIGPETVNTMPEETIRAFQDHGKVDADADEGRRRGAQAVRRSRGRRRRLRRRLRHARARRRAEVHRLLPGAARRNQRQARRARTRVTVATQQELVERIWARDATVWTGADEDKWLGWLDEPKRMRERAGEIAEFAAEARKKFETFVLLGMGGSSLAPEVLKQTFGAKQLHVLDTTHPSMIRHAEKSLDLSKTMFIVSSKSGGTLETLSHFEYFWEKTGGKGEQFIAITDPGSALEQLAKTRSMRVFAGEPTIGGRYSALSPFGIVPGRADGDRRRARARGRRAHGRCLPRRRQPGAAARPPARRRAGAKVATRCASTETEGRFGLWAEQLIAESTGKQGKGLVPAPGESPEGPDRQAAEVQLDDAHEIGAEFFRWEFAVAVAGAILEINPFDQPDVQAAKDKTKEVLASGDDPKLEPEGSLDELLARRRAAELHRDPGLHRPDARARAAAAHRPGARDRLRRHARAGSALPALHGTAAQGRSPDRALRPGRRRHR